MSAAPKSDDIVFNIVPTPALQAGWTKAILGLTHANDEQVELRVFAAAGGSPSFRRLYRPADVEAMIRDARRETRKQGVAYFTLNPICPDLAEGSASDKHIARRRLLMVDVDPRRPKDTSATAEEKAAAFEVAARVRDLLRSLGWPEPIVADSGNGAHLLYLIDLPNDDASRDLVKAILHGLAAGFDTERAQVDKTVHNASRVTKLYGCMSRKGSSTAERPHRFSKLLELPNRVEVVGRERLEAAREALAPVSKPGPVPAPAQQAREPEADGRRDVIATDAALGVRLANGDDDALLTLARRAKNGHVFSQLYDVGDWAAAGFQSESEARGSLQCRLAFWAMGDEARVRRLFDRSALAARSGKWAERDEEFRSGEIASAVARQTERYTPPIPRPGQDNLGGWRPQIVKPEDEGAGDDRSDGQRTRPLRFPCTDLGNAERLVDKFGEVIRYCHPWKNWLTYDGRRWKGDDTARVRRMAKKVARGIYLETRNAPDETLREQLAKHALSTEKASRIGAMVQLAEAEEGVPILPDEMDADPWSLNVLNGTIDLRTGELRPHRKADLITKLAPVEFDPKAECPLWETTLRLFLGDEVMVRYWQRICGYTLTGVIRDHVLPVCYGTGSNGKSTILGTLIEMLGRDYAMKAPPDLLMAKHGESHPTDKADLFGKRLVVAIETEQNRRLNETVIKELTGGDRIRARRMREDFWEFSPTHTLIMATNHRPVVRGTDNGIWRRLRLVPFTVSVSDDQADKTVPERLRAEFAGILAWCVRGCLDWQANGLEEPEKVRDATKDYRLDQDVVGAFLEECTLRHPDCSVKASVLYERFTRWADAANESKLNQRLFGEQLRERGIESKRSNGIMYRGIGLRHESPSSEEGVIE